MIIKTKAKIQYYKKKQIGSESLQGADTCTKPAREM